MVFSVTETGCNHCDLDMLSQFSNNNNGSDACTVHDLVRNNAHPDNVLHERELEHAVQFDLLVLQDVLATQNTCNSLNA